MNFSVIERNEERRQCLDFSLESLLQEQTSSAPLDPPPDHSPFPTFNNAPPPRFPLPAPPSPADPCPNDFLRDL